MTYCRSVKWTSLLLLVLSNLLFSEPVDEEAEHWAYQAPIKVEVKGHPVDALLARVRDDLGTTRAELAEPRRWVERASVTLTGLPARPEHVARIESQPDMETWQGILDELMASPAYGERWARHWMDVARYADTFGYNFMKDNRLPYAWTYRDWLIDFFNADRPWADFIRLQVAADLLVDRPNHPDLAALGFLTIGPRGRHELMVDDRVDVVTRGFMGTTVSCARCHDHKTDPISMTDYYSFYSILDNLDVETTKGPVIGPPADPKAHEDFLKKRAVIEGKNHKAREAVLAGLRNEESLAVYLELAWRGLQNGWDESKAGAEGFKRGRYRGKVIMQWVRFLEQRGTGEKAHPRLKRWLAAMKEERTRKQTSRALASEWLAAMRSGQGPLAQLAKHGQCPLSVDLDRAEQFFDQEDRQEQRGRTGELARLEGTHLGAPPRAMIVRNRERWSKARIFERGNPANKGEPFKQHWLTALGGGEYVEGLSPRLQMTEHVASSDNPLTGRAIVNRVWAWHFGQPLADPGDFGPQQPRPRQHELLDWLAVWFWEEGGSLKKLHRLLLTSEAYRLSSDGPAANRQIDEENSSYWKWGRQRLDFESMRDRILFTSGALDLDRVGGRSVKLESVPADRRRSLYAFVDRYALPSLLVNFDLPHPDHHSAGRVETTVPQQALFFLNGEMPIRQARRLVESPVFHSLTDDRERIDWLHRRVMGRPASPAEMGLILEWVKAAGTEDFVAPVGGQWTVGWADAGMEKVGSIKSFPLFADGMWKTGRDLSKAPIPYLSGGPDGGHASQAHVLVLRWTATGPGDFQLTGNVHRSGKQGPALLYQIAGSDGQVLAEAVLPQSSKTDIDAPWVSLRQGETMDFLIRAPDGHHTGSFLWNFRLMGREREGGDVKQLAISERDIPTASAVVPKPLATGDVWCDLVQMLWASNEFNHLD